MVASAATVIFNVALVFAATDRIEGRTPTVSGSMAKAWERRRVIFRWAVLSAVVGTAIRTVESRLGVAGWIVGLLGGLAWAVASFLVVPVLAFEDVGPIEAVKRSSHIFRSRFGTVARSGLRFEALFIGLSICAGLVVGFGLVIAAVGFAMSGVSGAAIGFSVAAVGLVLAIGIGMYASAASMYMRTILYRFATDQPIPNLGVDVARVFEKSPTPAIPAGWYHREGFAGLYWWNGEKWTSHTAPGPPPPGS